MLVLSMESDSSSRVVAGGPFVCGAKAWGGPAGRRAMLGFNSHLSVDRELEN